MNWISTVLLEIARQNELCYGICENGEFLDDYLDPLALHDIRPFFNLFSDQKPPRHLHLHTVHETRFPPHVQLFVTRLL